MLNKNTAHEIRIDDLTNLGFGVGKLDGMVVFVAGTVPGDVVSAKIIKVTKTYAVGKLEKLITPSDARCEGRCENALCNACPYKFLSYENELVLKNKSVEAAFKKCGLGDIKVLPTVPSPLPLFYRNKAQYPVKKEKNGEYVIGFFAPKSHRVIPAIECPLAKKSFSKILYTLKETFKKMQTTVYNEESGEGLLRHVYLRTNDKEDEILLALVINGDELPSAEVYEKVLKEKHPEIKGFLININKKNTNVILGECFKTVYGRDYIYDTLCGINLKVSAQSFYQVNHGTAEAIYTKAKELAKLSKSDTLLDLYCGLGSIGLSMAGEVKELLGVEIIEDAILRARENAKENGIENALFYASDAKNAESILSSAEKSLGRKIEPSVIILDPPRAGVDSSLISYVSTALSPQRIVYVSCNPATLARDVEIFRTFGYTTDTVYSYDMFPMTGHVESVVCLTRHNELPLA